MKNVKGWKAVSHIVWVHNTYYVWLLMGFALPFLLGLWVHGSLWGGFLSFLWGGVVRYFLAAHAFWLVNSIGHSFGQQTFHTNDQSRNNHWIAWLTLGAGWHNDHHAFPASARVGFQWQQVDFGGLLIRGMAKMGWVWNIVEIPDGVVEARKRLSQKRQNQIEVLN